MTSNPHIDKLLVYLNLTVLLIAIIIGLIFLYQHINIFEELSHAIGLIRYVINEQEEATKKANYERDIILSETLNISKNLTKDIHENTNNKLDRILEILNK